MHARDVLLGSLIERSARASAQTQLLSGITADFLEQIFYADRLAPGNRGSNGSARPGKMAKIAKLIEDRIIGGKIIIEHSAILNQPIIKYQPKGWKKNTLPLPSTSAMVTELAALVIFLRYGIEAGDVLIFEEPEAGLHPAKQPELMQVLAAIVNAGVKVVMTTHSDWIMEKLANVILNGDKPDKLPAQNRFALGEDQVGAWLFKNKGQKGTIVAEIPFEEHGLYETGYREVSSQLYNEWRPLSERRQEKSVQAFSK
ncbi:MAG: AAA family ATPase [Betaproteobacteria bacterium]|nr:AAA family ATPase [Betaproteobacteria bacterium]